MLGFITFAKWLADTLFRFWHFLAFETLLFSIIEAFLLFCTSVTEGEMIGINIL